MKTPLLPFNLRAATYTSHIESSGLYNDEERKILTPDRSRDAPLCVSLCASMKKREAALALAVKMGIGPRDFFNRQISATFTSDRATIEIADPAEDRCCIERVAPENATSYSAG